MKGSSQPLPQKKPRKRSSRKDLAAKKAANASSSRSVPPTGFADRVPMKGTALIHFAGEPDPPAETAGEHIRGSQETARPCIVDREKPSRVERSRISTLCGACASGHGLRRHGTRGSVLPAV